MKKIIISPGVTLSLVLMVTITLAFGSKLDRSFGIRAESKYSFSSIPNLTAEQSSRIQVLRRTLLKEIEPLQRELMIKRAELNTYESNPDVDQTAIMAKEKKVWQIQSELHEKIAGVTYEAMKLLTPEQQAHLPDFSSGVVGERGFNPIMSEMWGFGRQEPEISTAKGFREESR
jgi:Spy/CpxP family protein refolding chaperone